MRKRNAGAIPVSLLVLLGFFSGSCKKAGPKYVTDKITRGDVVTAVTATGTVNAVTSVNVGTQVSGRITKLFVDYNSPVKTWSPRARWTRPRPAP